MKDPKRKHKKKEKMPLFRAEQKSPSFKINVEFPENDTETVEIKKEHESVKDESESVKDESVKQVHHEIDFDKIINDVINDMINNDAIKDDGFAILSKTPNNSEEHSSEDEQ